MPTMTTNDIMQWSETYTGAPFHAVLCDPPYHLTEITKRFGDADAAPATYGTDGAFQRASRGFMGRQWDGGDVAFQPDTWAAIARHLLPGAFGMAFAGSRGWHRMAVAIEDAGLLIHPTIGFRGWTYASGFPKATRLDRRLDDRAGAARPVVAVRKHQPKFAAAEFGYREKDNGYNDRARQTFAETAPATELAQAWAGHRYGAQALKPALEPIIVFQKPYDGQALDSIVTYGAGAFNIEAARIPLREGETNTYGSGNLGAWRELEGRSSTQDATVTTGSNAGRWPANLITCHHPACDESACHPACVVETLAIAHCFAQPDWLLDRLEATDPITYVPKPTAAEREAGLDPRQIALMRQLADDDLPEFPETTVDDGRQTPIDNPYLRGETTRRNTHPTIKPISLARYLATLLLPPAIVPGRRLLVPFAGTGSEVIGGMLAGWDDVMGVELEADHVAIANARIAYWQQRRASLADGRPITVRSRKPAAATALQPDLFDERNDA